MAITKTDYNNNFGGPDQKSENPITERKREQLVKEKKRLTERIDKKLEQLKLSDLIRNVALSSQYKTAQNPNDDPQALFNQVDDTLSKMGLKNLAERNKTQLVIGKTNAKKENLYQVQLRRQAEIRSDEIKKINREDANFEVMEWTAQGIAVYVWAPYTPPAEEEIPETL